MTRAALRKAWVGLSSQAVQDHELTGFWLTTPHPELAIPPDRTETIPLTFRNANLPPQRAELEVSGVPSGWKWSLKGGNREVGDQMQGAIVGAPLPTVQSLLVVLAANSGLDAAMILVFTLAYVVFQRRRSGHDGGAGRGRCAHRPI